MVTIDVGSPGTSLKYDLALGLTSDWTWIPDNTCPSACSYFIKNARPWTGYDVSINGGSFVPGNLKTFMYSVEATFNGKIIDNV